MDSRCAVLEVDVMGKIKATHRETRVKRTPLGPLLVSATVSTLNTGSDKLRNNSYLSANLTCFIANLSQLAVPGRITNFFSGKQTLTDTFWKNFKCPLNAGFS